MAGTPDQKEDKGYMTCDAQLCQAINSLGIPVEPNLNTDASVEYVVYEYTSDGTLFGDDAPILDYRRWNLFYAAPTGANRLAVRHRIRDEIFRVFDVWPSEENVSNEQGQLYLFQFETVGGIDDGKPGDE